MKLKVGVLDDDAGFLRSFSAMLEKCLADCGHCASISLYETWDAMHADLCRGNIPDVLFCDILLPESNGIQLADILQTGYPQIKVVFITAVLANAVDIFQASPSYFLVKPIQSARLLDAVQTVVKELERDRSPENSLVIASAGGVCIIQKNLLEYVEIKNRMLAFHEIGRTITVRAKLDETAAKLGNSFFRCHKSYLIHLRFVRRLEKETAEMLSGAQVPVARTRLQETKSAFFAYARSRQEKRDFV